MGATAAKVHNVRNPDVAPFLPIVSCWWYLRLRLEPLYTRRIFRFSGGRSDQEFASQWVESRVGVGNRLSSGRPGGT